MRNGGKGGKSERDRNKRRTFFSSRLVGRKFFHLRVRPGNLALKGERAMRWRRMTSARFCHIRIGRAWSAGTPWSERNIGSLRPPFPAFCAGCWKMSCPCRTPVPSRWTAPWSPAWHPLLRTWPHVACVWACHSSHAGRLDDAAAAGGRAWNFAVSASSVPAWPNGCAACRMHPTADSPTRSGRRSPWSSNRSPRPRADRLKQKGRDRCYWMAALAGDSWGTKQVRKFSDDPAPKFEDRVRGASFFHDVTKSTEVILSFATTHFHLPTRDSICF